MNETIIPIHQRGPGDRQNVIDTIYIEHDRYREAIAGIKRAHMPVNGGSPGKGRLSIEAGDSRTGKTYAARRYLKLFPPTAGEEGVVRRVVYFETPADGGLRAWLECLADALEMKFSHRMNTPSLLSAVLAMLVRCGVELLIWDEVQDMFDGHNKRLLNQGRKLLRKILNLGTLNIVCIGLLETYGIMQADKQLTGRGGLPYTILRPYSWESIEEKKSFRLLCDEFDRRLPFEKLAGMGSERLAYRLFWVSEGNIGRLKQFISDAGYLAINDDTSQIEQRHFAEAYERVKPYGTTYNPFIHDPSLAPKRERPSQVTTNMSPSEVFSKKPGPQGPETNA